MNPSEQSAFCRVAQRLAAAAIDGRIHPRAESDLRTQLCLLYPHHRTNIVLPSTYHMPVTVIDDFPTTPQLEIPQFKARIRQTFPAEHYIDLELHLTDGRVLVAELDQAPNEVIRVDLNRLPAWLRFK